MECPFCDLANLGARKFYENELFIAIYNLRPLVEGHVLVMPKRHVESVFDFNDAEKAGFFSFFDRCAFISLKYSSAYQFDAIMQEGTAAGESVPHAHAHILPRSANDHIAAGKAEWFEKFSENEKDTRRNLPKDEMERIVKRLRFIAKEHAIQLESI